MRVHYNPKSVVSVKPRKTNRNHIGRKANINRMLFDLSVFYDDIQIIIHIPLRIDHMASV